MSSIALVIVGVIVGAVSAIAAFASGSGLIAGFFGYILGGAFGILIVVLSHLMLDLFAQERPNSRHVAHRESH